MDVVISGISGRFPRSNNVTEFCDSLLKGEHLLEPIERWSSGVLDTPKLYGQSQAAFKFDYTFFGIHYNVAKSADPMMRIAMETAFEAVIDAGICPTALRGTNAQVYSCCIQLEGDCMYNEEKNLSGYVIMGRNRCLFSNRISYFFNLTGRSTAYDGSSGWIGNGLKLARQAILSGECDTVFVHGCSLMYLPDITRQKQDFGLLSPDSTTHPFDIDINGCGRGEAQVTFLIQRADIAKRSYVSIVAADARHQGILPNWFLSVNKEHLENFVTSLYKENGVDPNDVKLLEADGLCIKDMVESELNVLDKVLNSKRRKDSPLYLGSVKTLTGDTDGSAGHIGLIKLILAMDTGVISPTVDCGKLNPNIPGLVNNRYKVVTEPTTWEVTSDTLAALSSVTYNGVVSHVVIRANGKAKDRNVKKDYPLPYLVFVSGKDEDFIHKALKEVTSSPFDPEYLRLTQEVFAPTIPKFEWKGYGFHGQDESKVFVVQRENRRPVWFVYSGMGSQWPQMGKYLLDFPVVKETLQRLHKVLEPKGIDLLNILTTGDEYIFDNIMHSFVGIASIQIALTNLLDRLGIKFDGLIGHSVGELGCSYADGCLTEEQTILAAYERGMASLKADLIPGLMAAVGLGYTQAKDLLPPDVFVACRNSRESCTISGPTESVKNVISSFNAKNIFVRGVNVSNIAYHSPYIRPAAPYLHEALRKVIPSPKPRSEKWICTSAPKEKWDTDEVRYCSADYHTNNLLNPVLFEEGSAYIPKNALLIEIAPHGLLQAILKRSLSKDVVHVTLTRRNAEDPAELLLEAIGKLYVEGLSPQIWHLYPDVSFPVSRSTPSLTNLLKWDHRDLFPIISRVERLKEVTLPVFINSPSMEIDGETCLLPSYTLVLIWKKFSEINNFSMSDLTFVFEDVRFYDVIRLDKEDAVNVGMFFSPSGNFDVTRNEVLVARGRIRVYDTERDSPCKLPAVSDIVDSSLDSEEVYFELNSRCVDLPENLKSIRSLQTGPCDWTAEVPFHEDWSTLLNSLCTLFKLQNCEKNQGAVFLNHIQRLTIDPTKDNCDSTARLHLPTMTLTYRGVILIRPTFRSIKNTKPRWEPISMVFVPFGQTDLEETEQLLHYVAQLGLEKRIFSTSLFKIYDEDNKFSSLSALLCNILKTSFSSKCELVSEAEDANLIICSPDFFEDFTKPVFSHNCLYLTRRCHDFSKISLNGLQIIAESRVRETANSLVVLNKVLPPIHPADCKIVMMKPQDVISQSEIYSDYSLVIFVWENGTCESIERIFAEVATWEFSEKVRLVFLMTRDAPPFSVSLPLYADQIRLNLLVNIYLDGHWGSYRLIPLPKKSLCNGNTGEIDFVRSERVKLDFGDSGSNLAGQMISSCPKKVVGYALDFQSGERIMGVGRCESGHSRYIVPDPHLKWSIPRSWSIEDAAVVPNAFATAYLALMEVSRLAAKEVVVITCPLNPIGQAAIRIANSLGCVTVVLLKSCEEERQLLKMPYVKPRHIIVSGYLTAVYSIKKIAPQGVNVILSDAGGEAVTTLGCTFTGLGRGRILQIGEDAMHKAECIGMLMFLRHVFVEGVTHERVVNASEEVKRRVVKRVKDGLENGVVVLLSSAEKETAVTNGFGTLSEINGYNQEYGEEDASPTSPLDSQKQKCLIVGGSPPLWIRLSYCLARKGYKLIALLPGKQSPNLFIRHSRILHADYATELRELKTFDQLQNSDIGVLHDIFIFGRTSFAEDVSRLLDSKSLKDTRVTFFSCGSTQFSRKCDRWNRDGLKVRAALGVEDVPIDTAGPHLDWILSPAAPPVSVLDRSSFSVKSQKSLTETGCLPSSVSELQDLGESIRNYSSPIFRKLVTRCSSVRQNCEVNPLFFIKGLHKTASSELAALGTSLYAPLVEITLQADCGSLEAVARDVIQGIQKIQSLGPYNLCGDLIRTNVVLRVARILEDNGFASVVFLLDEEIDLRSLAAAHKENRLGEFLLKFSIGECLDAVDWKSVSWNELTWADQVIAAVSKIRSSDMNIPEAISAALHHIYNSVLHIIEKEEVVLEHGIVHVLTEGDESGEYKTRHGVYNHIVPSSKLKRKDISGILSPNLGTPVLQLECDRAMRTGLL